MYMSDQHRTHEELSQPGTKKIATVRLVSAFDPDVVEENKAHVAKMVSEFYQVEKAHSAKMVNEFYEVIGHSYGDEINQIVTSEDLEKFKMLTFIKKFAQRNKLPPNSIILKNGIQFLTNTTNPNPDSENDLHLILFTDLRTGKSDNVQQKINLLGMIYDMGNKSGLLDKLKDVAKSVASLKEQTPGIMKLKILKSIVEILPPPPKKVEDSLVNEEKLLYEVGLQVGFSNPSLSETPPGSHTFYCRFYGPISRRIDEKLEMATLNLFDSAGKVVGEKSTRKSFFDSAGKVVGEQKTRKRSFKQELSVMRVSDKDTRTMQMKLLYAVAILADKYNKNKHDEPIKSAIEFIKRVKRTFWNRTQFKPNNYVLRQRLLKLMRLKVNKATDEKLYNELTTMLKEKQTYRSVLFSKTRNWFTRRR
jgi:hypothetical protein